jgi:lysozyme
MKKISRVGIELLHSSEACVLTRYKDTAGLWTIGWGHLIKPGESYVKITKQEANAIFLRDLIAFENAVVDGVKVPIGQNQYDALVSIAFNIGVGAFLRSTLLKKLNRGDYLGAADQFLVWNKSGGKLTKGLENRRKRERALFLRSETGSTQVDVPDTDEPVIPLEAVIEQQKSVPELSAVEPASIMKRLEDAATRVQASPLTTVVQASVNSEKRTWVVRFLSGFASLQTVMTWITGHITISILIFTALVVGAGLLIFWLWGKSDSQRRELASKEGVIK